MWRYIHHWKEERRSDGGLDRPDASTRSRRFLLEYMYTSILQLKKQKHTCISKYVNQWHQHLVIQAYKYSTLQGLYVYIYIQTRYLSNHMQTSRIEICLCSFPLSHISILIRLVMKTSFSNHNSHHAMHAFILFPCLWIQEHQLTGARSINSGLTVSIAKSINSRLTLVPLVRHQPVGIVSHTKSINSMVSHWL